MGSWGLGNSDVQIFDEISIHTVLEISEYWQDQVGYVEDKNKPTKRSAQEVSCEVFEGEEKGSRA